MILIILATVSINAIFGENGLIQSTQKAKIEHEKAEAREQIELVLADAYAEKNVNKKEYNENEYLDNFVKEELADIQIEKEKIGLNGYIFELDRSVPKIGRYLGQSTGPQIQNIKVIGKTTNSVSVEVEATNAENGKYTYSYKKENEGENAWKKAGEGKENTYTINQLESNVIYNVKVELETKDGKAEGIVNVLTGELPEGTITFGKVTWVGEGTASVIINTSASGYTLQYQINGIEEGKWQDTTSGSTINGLHHDDTVYGRLTDGTNKGNYTSTIILDKEKPKNANISLSGTSASTTKGITATVNHIDGESGINISSCKWEYNTTNSQIGEEETKYTNTFSSDGEKINLSANNVGTYYLHVLTVDKAGNKTETISQGITVEQLASNVNELEKGNYVNYIDALGNTQKCVVLYDSKSPYGVEIISMSAMLNVTLGGSNFNQVNSSYNGAQNLLNSTASQFNNSTYSTGARSVGCIPNNINSHSAYYAFPSSLAEYNIQLIDTDNNYLTDWNQMTSLGIENIYSNYWLASYHVYKQTNSTVYFCVRNVQSNGTLTSTKLCDMSLEYYNPGSGGYNTYGVRPVFKLKSTLKVTGGNGTSSNPYTLGI